MERFFIAENSSQFAEDFLQWKKNTRILDKLIIELDEKHNFGMDEYWRSMHELKIKFKTPEDRSRFEGHLRNDGAFRKSSKYHKEWINTLAERGVERYWQVHIASYIPYLPGVVSARTFQRGNPLYVSIQNDYLDTIEIPDWLTEIKGSEFHKALEEIEK